MKEYKNYIFDLYGTLVDIHTDESSIPFWRNIAKLFKTYGFVYNPKELKTKYFELIHNLESKQSKKNHNIEIDLVEVFKSLTNNSLNNNDLHELMISFRTYSTTHIRKYANIDKLFNELRNRNKNIYLLSNAQSCFTLYELDKLDLIDKFDDIYISSEIGYKKPDPYFLKSLMKKHKLKRNETILIGNDLNSDILCANSCDIDSLYIEDQLSSKANKKIKSTFFIKGMSINKVIKML